jgi:hypothetical protein
MNLKDMRTDLDEGGEHLQSAVTGLNVLLGNDGLAETTSKVGGQVAPEVPTNSERDHRCGLYGIFRDYLKHEDDLINGRLNWNFTIQGFLFASYCFCLQKVAEVRGQVLPKTDFQYAASMDFALAVHELRLVMIVIAAVGFFVSAFVLMSVWAATLAMHELETKWRAINGQQPKIEDKISWIKSLRSLLTTKATSPDEKTHCGELPGLTGGGDPLAHQFGLNAPLILPPVFIVAWLFLGLYSLSIWIWTMVI